MNITKSIISLVLIGAIVGLVYWGTAWLEANRNKSSSEIPEPIVPKVKVHVVELEDYQVSVQANGKVEAARRSQLSAEISGTLIAVSDRVRVGNVLKKDELIAEIDVSDFKAVLANAKASVADAQLMIVQEEARAAMNIKEWKKLGKGEPTDLVARKPQLASANAKLESAKASVIKAERDIERAKIFAPYEMRIEAKYAEVGNFIAPGGRLIDGHSANEFEVRMPLRVEDYLLVKNQKVPVKLVAELGGKRLEWTGIYERDEGVVDQRTLSMPVMVRIEKNESQGRFAYPPVGLYLRASIKANKMLGKAVIPRDYIRLGDIVLLVTDKNTILKREVEVLYQDKDVAVIEGLKPGERIVSSPLEAPMNGMVVEIVKDPSMDSLPEGQEGKEKPNNEAKVKADGESGEPEAAQEGGKVSTQFDREFDNQATSANAN